MKIALESVRRQSIFAETEVLIVDNCSVDGTREMLREEFPWVKLVERETNSGLAEGRNILVRLASAPIVFWMDDDCELVENDCLERLVAEIEAHPEYAVVFARILEGDDGPLHTFLPADVSPEEFQMQKAFPATFASGGTCVRKQQFLDIGGYDGDFFRMGVESAFAYKAFTACLLICYFPAVTIIHRPHSSGRNFRVITYYSTRNYLLGLWRYMPLCAAILYTLFEIASRSVHCLRRPAHLAGFAQGLLAAAWRFPRCLLRERKPMGKVAFSRWVHARHYLIRSIHEFDGIPERCGLWRLIVMQVKIRCLRRFGWSRPHPFPEYSKENQLAHKELD